VLGEAAMPAASSTEHRGTVVRTASLPQDQGLGAPTARLDELVASHRRLWHDAADGTPELGPPVPWRRRLANGRAARRLLDEVAEELERCPPAGPARTAWQSRLQQRIRAFGERRLGWPAGYRRLLVGDEFFAASVAFARRARRFDTAMSWSDIGQALRNMWIVNSLQLLLDAPVALTPSSFAYSMLYPYTDNLLDDPRVAPAEKVEFNRALDRRLRGESVPPLDARQRAVWRLVGEIEAEYPRPDYPRVHEALLAIQAGQVRSLDQQSPVGLDAEALLDLSLAKGGASVLVDGWIVRGVASPAEEEFFFGYGVFLQLLDDLQDAGPDAAAGHRTLFSQALADGPLDRPASRLHHLMGSILDGSSCFGGPQFAARRDLIRRNCTFLLVAAVAQSPGHFSRGFRRHLQRRWPLQLRAMRRLRRRASERFRRAAETLRRSQGDDPDAMLDGVSIAAEGPTGVAGARKNAAPPPRTGPTSVAPAQYR
jgi:hypothetical protein